METKTQLKKHIIVVIILVMSISAPIFSQQKGKITIKTSPEIKRILTKKLDYNKNLKPVAKYTIQLFYGSEQQSIRIKNNFNSIYSKYKAKLKFYSPDWKVLAGSFKTRLEADRSLAIIKERFPYATVRNPKIKK